MMVGNMKGKICASIVSEGSHAMLESAKKALFDGADLVELRLDHLSAIDKGLPAVIRREGLSGRCIITIRKKSQGGLFKGPEKRRLSLLELFSTITKPLYLDVELETARRNRKMIEKLRKRGQQIIISHHDFEKTPGTEELYSRYREARAMKSLSKIVTMANLPDDNLRILSLYGKTGKNNDLIAFTMGSIGQLTRILCISLGSPLTYVSYGSKAAAPGQLSLETARRIVLAMQQSGAGNTDTDYR